MPQQEIDTRSDGRFAFPLPPRLLTIDGVQPLELRVQEVSDVGPLRRICLAGAGPSFQFKAGQDVMLVLSGGERPLSRRYTIRGFDPKADSLELNIVTHGVHGPGADWANNTQPGDRINGVGPRGKIFLNDAADWHLWFGDESAIAATLAMLESLPAGANAKAFIEVATADDQVGDDNRIQWLYRGADKPAWASDLLAERMAAVELPAGRGHIYINGEVQIVAAVQKAALARGLEAGQLAPKAYWGRGKANAVNGEPEKELRDALMR
jgi:NADPH-dependent ferric siderophore reductase